MRTTLVSDAHLRGLRDPAQDALVRFCDELETDELVLVGDVFDVWWGWSTAVPGGFAPILAALDRAIRRGMRVCMVPGNHDFAPGGFLVSMGIVVTERWQSEDRRVIAVHGDATESRRQRILDAVIRGSALRAVSRVVGPDTTLRIAERVSARSRAHNGSANPALLDRQRRLAARLLADADVVCVGHSHCPGIESVGHGTLVNLGDWLDHRSFATVDGEVALWRWSPDAPPARVEGPMSRRV